uniref:hypothetical protein n=1 Tax=Prevotella heparinolytica TaxID=28113 RepID=UPI0035A049F3
QRRMPESSPLQLEFIASADAVRGVRQGVDHSHKKRETLQSDKACPLQRSKISFNSRQAFFLDMFHYL